VSRCDSRILAVDSRDRIDTIIDFAAAREYGAKAEGSSAALNASVLTELAALIASGDLEVAIAATFPLDQVQAAFSLLGQGHIRGKIVLLPKKQQMRWTPRGAHLLLQVRVQTRLHAFIAIVQAAIARCLPVSVS
jgi:hypothetical protein